MFAATPAHALMNHCEHPISNGKHRPVESHQTLDADAIGPWYWPTPRWAGGSLPLNTIVQWPCLRICGEIGTMHCHSLPQKPAHRPRISDGSWRCFGPWSFAASAAMARTLLHAPWMYRIGSMICWTVPYIVMLVVPGGSFMMLALWWYRRKRATPCVPRQGGAWHGGVDVAAGRAAPSRL